jgi:beta-lactamase superfamily II metal-dependent hydrolase
MKLHIFNVGHGFCALLKTSNGGVMLFDCGHSDGSLHPSKLLPQNGIKIIHRFYLSHFDADHVSDLAALRQACTINALFRNRTLPAQVIREDKAAVGGTTLGLDHALYMHDTYVQPMPAEPDFQGANVLSFFNSYPPFTDMNNLSLVSFVDLAGVGVLIPGDLERAGWLKLLEREDFRNMLGRVHVFVASHHGRENGYCKEIFDYCKPQVVVISDTDKQHESQEHCYDSHAKGINWVGGGTRYVLTTRSDGHVTIAADGNGRATVTASRVIPVL